MELKRSKIPTEVLEVHGALTKAGFEAYIVGGCVRDLLLGRAPKDWDITSNATPEQIQGLFKETFYENAFGTVGVVNETDNPTLKVVEVTPYRIEGEYTDARRPSVVAWGTSIEEDLKRRDFTINAMAYDPSQGQLIDLYDGIKDISQGHIRAVGDASARFKEDALRTLRAIRIAAELGFEIEEVTKEAIKASAGQLEKISKERIRDEFVRIILSPQPQKTLILSQELGVLPYILPELLEGVGIEQNQAHKYDVYEHSLRALQHAADKGWPLEVRLAALLHDVGKPATRRWGEDKKDWTFHGHEVVGAKMAKKILERLKFSHETLNKVVTLIRWHMFFSDPDKVTLSAVRRIVTNVQRENIWDLINLRICDRIGTGRPKEQPFRLRKYQSMIEQALRDPISVGMLKIDGKRYMELTGEGPGPRIGWVLHALLEEVLDNPDKNTIKHLEGGAQELAKLSDTELRAAGEEGKEKRAQAEAAEIKDIEKKYFVE
ncbi:MAG: CCA tRNA nucleotidyltransferase [Patescibacteria group bacterium]|nr:CCA tRNA nucleotidyltransferase [Patescibacteria group bacterium]